MRFNHLLLLLSLASPLALQAQGLEKCDEIKELYQSLPDVEAFDNLTNKFYELGDYKNGYYMVIQSRTYNPDYKTVEYEKLFLELREKQEESQDCGCELPEKPEWESLNGPLGADATSFYLDDNGGYWLGTGSSGGVFYSADKGKTWAAKNNGIGPWHIVDIFEMGDTLYIQVNGNKGGKNSDIRLYWFDFKSEFWNYIPGYIGWSSSYAEGRAGAVYWVHHGSDYEVYDAGLSPELNYGHFTGGEYSYVSDSYMYNRGISAEFTFTGRDWEYAGLRVFGFKEKNTSSANLNKMFPRDVFGLENGNLFELSNNEKLLLSKSGPYLVQNMSNIRPLGKEGLLASDVTQLIHTNDKLYALVNEADIWKYENGEWIMLFNAYQRHLERKDPISIRGYDTRQINVQKDGTFFFSFCGELWTMDPNEEFSKIEIDLDSYKGDCEECTSTRAIVNTAGYDNDGNLVVLLDIIEFTAEEGRLEGGRVENWNHGSQLIRRNKGSSKFEEIDGWGNFIFNDKSGQLWIASAELKKIYEEDGSGLEDMMGLNNVNQIDSKENGDVLIHCYYTFHEYSASEDQWNEVAYFKEELSTCIAYGEDGKIYAGTGKKYARGCGGGPYEGDDNGTFVFDGEKWQPVLGCVNNWTYSLRYIPGMGMAVGTSGSGVQLLKDSK